MFHLDTVFEWIVNGTIGQVTTGTIPLVIWLVITILFWLSTMYLANRWGGLKWVGKYIFKTCSILATAGLFLSLFTTAYGYRGTPIDATAKNLLLINTGSYQIVKVIDGIGGSENGKVFVIAPIEGTPNWEKLQIVYAADFQIQVPGEIRDGNEISVMSYKDYSFFGPKVNLPGEQPEQQQLTMTTTTDDH